MAPSLNKISDNVYHLCGLDFTPSMPYGREFRDCPEFSVNRWSCQSYELSKFNLPDIEIYYPPFNVNLISGIANLKNDFRSESPHPYIFQWLFDNGFFKSIGAIDIHYGKGRDHYSEYGKDRVRDFKENLTIDLHLYHYGFTAAVWITVPFESFMEMDVLTLMQTEPYLNWLDTKITKNKRSITNKTKLNAILNAINCHCHHKGVAAKKKPIIIKTCDCCEREYETKMPLQKCCSKHCSSTLTNRRMKLIKTAA